MVRYISLIIIILSFVLSCSKESTTEPESNTPGINASDFAFAVGNEWNYNGAGYKSSGIKLPKSVNAIKIRVISETNSNGLNGYKLYTTLKDFDGKTYSESEDFTSTENKGLWTLEKLANGSTSPVKILPFEVNSATIRSDVINKQMRLGSWTPPYYEYIENITMNIDIKYKFIGTENVTTSAGVFNNSKKIKVTIDISQRSDTSGVELFNGKTWFVESYWWLSNKNGLIKTETSFNSVIDSIANVIWTPNGGYIIEYKDIIEKSFSYRDLRYFDVNDLMIPVSSPWYKEKISGLRYLGKYITELSSKNF